MPEPEKDQFACIGCGALNPVGAEVCSGCKHRFAGPGGGMRPESGRVSAPTPEEPPGSNFPRKSASEPTALGWITRAISIFLTIIATIFAFGITFLVTCSAVADKQGAVWLATFAGLAAGGVVVGLVVWLRNLSGSNRGPIKHERRREDR